MKRVSLYNWVASPTIISGFIDPCVVTMCAYNTYNGEDIEMSRANVKNNKPPWVLEMHILPFINKVPIINIFLIYHIETF